MLDIERIQQLVDMMVAHDLVEVSLRDGDTEVKVRRPNSNPGGGVPGTGAMPIDRAADKAATPVPSDEDEAVELAEIKSPMVGTFFAAPDPEASPFVQVGSRVHASTVVCIVEAMKVYNEIKAEVAGIIERVVVENEAPVEFGQPLFQVRPE